MTVKLWKTHSDIGEGSGEPFGSPV